MLNELEPEQLKISPMPKTWILDLDGTILVHDGPLLYKALRTFRYHRYPVFPFQR